MGRLRKRHVPFFDVEVFILVPMLESAARKDESAVAASIDGELIFLQCSARCDTLPVWSSASLVSSSGIV
jgi:hypothetical protein